MENPAKLNTASGKLFREHPVLTGRVIPVGIQKFPTG